MLRIEILSPRTLPNTNKRTDRQPVTGTKSVRKVLCDFFTVGKGWIARKGNLAHLDNFTGVSVESHGY